jgi:hypothetical protein
MELIRGATFDQFECSFEQVDEVRDNSRFAQTECLRNAAINRIQVIALHRLTTDCQVISLPNKSF